jgi:hypothetical protein
MWNNYIGSQIRRANRNLMVMNAVLMAILVVVLVISRRYLYNALAGPFPTTVDAIGGLSDPETLDHYFVSIQGVQAVRAGLQVMDQRVNKYTRAVQSETLAATYFAVRTHGKLLLIKSPAAAPAMSYTGALVTAGKDVKDFYETKLRARNLNFNDVFLPIVLDATSFRAPAYWELGICIPLLLLGLFNLGKGVVRGMDPKNSPVAKALSKYGPPEQIAAGIQNELAQYGNRSPLRHTVLTVSWLLRESYYNLQAVHLNDVVWAYQKVTRHRTNGIPTGTTFGVIVGNRNGKRMECAGKQPEVIKMIEAIHAGVPWIMAGYSAELNTMFAQRPAEFAAMVDQRRNQFYQSRSAGQGRQ